MEPIPSNWIIMRYSDNEGPVVLLSRGCRAAHTDLYSETWTETLPKWTFTRINTHPKIAKTQNCNVVVWT